MCRWFSAIDLFHRQKRPRSRVKTCKVSRSFWTKLGELYWHILRNIFVYDFVKVLSHGLQTAAVLHLKNAARIGGTELLTYGERMGFLDVVKQRRFFFAARNRLENLMEKSNMEKEDRNTS